MSLKSRIVVFPFWLETTLIWLPLPFLCLIILLFVLDSFQPNCGTDTLVSHFSSNRNIDLLCWKEALIWNKSLVMKTVEPRSAVKCSLRPFFSKAVLVHMNSRLPAGQRSRPHDALAIILRLLSKASSWNITQRVLKENQACCLPQFKEMSADITYI